MSRIVSFTEDMRQRGFVPGTRVLSAQLIPASKDIAEKLHVDPDELLARIERLRTAEGEPMSIEESYLVHRYCPSVLQHDYSTQPLREILDRDYSIRLVYAKQVIRAILASKELAGLLEIKASSPLLFIERVTYSQGEIPVEFLRVHYRADRYSLYNELRE
jgi:GntR family transcriptional regulator